MISGAHVYMLLCSDGSYYVGLTHREELGARISEHQLGVVSGYTSSRRPVTLVWSEHFPIIVDAIRAERQIKGWSRAKKKAPIRRDWDVIQSLARRRSGRPN